MPTKKQSILLYILLESKKPLTRVELGNIASTLPQINFVPLFPIYTFLEVNDEKISFELRKDIDKLVGSGLIQEQDRTLNNNLSKEAINAAYKVPFEDQQIIKQAVHTLATAPHASSCQEKSQRAVTAPTTDAIKAIFTVGYENDSIDSFFKKIIEKGIRQIIDVRKNPVSRKFGFSKKKLSEAANSLDITYVHIPELGIPSSLRSHLKTEDDYAELFSLYEKSILPKTKDNQNTVIHLIKEKPSALLCYEANKEMCHRTVLANHLSKATSLKVFDIH